MRRFYIDPLFCIGIDPAIVNLAARKYESDRRRGLFKQSQFEVEITGG
jgi:hypothetical protein